VFLEQGRKALRYITHFNLKSLYHDYDHAYVFFVGLLGRKDGADVTETRNVIPSS